MNCRHCGKPLQHVFLDLGFSPPSNDYLTESDLHALEVWFPLRLYVCDECWLVQTEDYSRPDQLFRQDYAYFSSTSRTWVDHARCYVGEMRERLVLDGKSLVIEVASNDGYLLKHFVAAGIPCLGIEPTASTAAAAEALGIPVLREFFDARLGHELAARGQQADLILGNNVLAHVPDINDFCAGLCSVLKPGGTATLEFPHLLELIAHNAFDTVYHEHYSYLSLYTVDRILASAGLRVFDVEQLSTHGGSLRVFACHADEARATATAVEELLGIESSAGLRDLASYGALQPRIAKVKHDLLAFLVNRKLEGQRVVAYGAAAKGNTLLNYAGVRPDLLSFVCDAAPSKQGKYLPGSHIPVLPPAALREYKPDFVIILPWNIADEITHEHGYISEWGGQFVVAIPGLTVGTTLA